MAVFSRQTNTDGQTVTSRQTDSQKDRQNEACSIGETRTSKPSEERKSAWDERDEWRRNSEPH